MSAPSHHGDHVTRHSYRGYVVVALILSAITIVEVLIPSLAALRSALGRFGTVALLLVLSFTKGAGVLMYYMHLRRDSRLFTGLFMFPFLIASAIVIIVFVFYATYTGSTL
ncbi:MAG: cytochrome C oxidase subunit IV family protein [Actinobacteria bacterium]|nr:cytochrome C oxidase subunit IV family protein [Actinomycetota bacterium]